MSPRRLRPPHKIMIKHPRLRKLRDNLRRIIQLAVLDESNRLLSLSYLYSNKRRNFGQLTPSQIRRKVYLNKLRENLRFTFENSIGVCISRVLEGGFNGDISGDRVRCSFVSEYDKYIYGLKYLVEEKWVSLPYYENNKANLGMHYHYYNLKDDFNNEEVFSLDNLYRTQYLLRI